MNKTFSYILIFFLSIVDVNAENKITLQDVAIVVEDFIDITNNNTHEIKENTNLIKINQKRLKTLQKEITKIEANLENLKKVEVKNTSKIEPPIYLIVDGIYANIRTQPDKESKKIKRLKKGEILIFKKYENNWIETNMGYVYKDLVKIKGLTND